MSPQYETPPPLGGLVLGVVCAGAVFEAPPGVVFVDEEPQAVKPAATARPRAAPNISFRGANRLSRMNILSSTGTPLGRSNITYIRRKWRNSSQPKLWTSPPMCPARGPTGSSALEQDDLEHHDVGAERAEAMA